MKHISSLRLYRCWAALKGRKEIPARRDLRPHLLGGAMLDLFTLRPDSFIFGYAGSRLRAGLAQPLDHLDFPAVWRPHDRTAVLRLLHGIVTHGGPVLVGARHAAAGRDAEQAEILLLPTGEPSGGISLVGVLAASSAWTSARRGGDLLTLAALSTPEQALLEEGRPNAEKPAGPPPLRPRLMALSVSDGHNSAEILKP